MNEKHSQNRSTPPYPTHTEPLSRRTPRVRISGPDRAAGEKDDPLQLLVVEEVVEGPEAAFLSEGVRIQVWVVAVEKVKPVSQPPAQRRATNLHRRD